MAPKKSKPSLKPEADNTEVLRCIKNGGGLLAETQLLKGQNKAERKLFWRISHAPRHGQLAVLNISLCIPVPDMPADQCQLLPGEHT